ncbi:hypothetical protein BLOT_016792 [Blomia tropicalis]|nr:hypothetical protein BLOT_016792 [Blomia tropicalis]
MRCLSVISAESQHYSGGHGKSPMGMRKRISNVSLISLCANIVGLEKDETHTVQACDKMYKDAILGPLSERCTAILEVNDPVKLWGMIGVGSMRFTKEKDDAMLIEGSSILQTRINRFYDDVTNVTLFDTLLISLMKAMGEMASSIHRVPNGIRMDWLFPGIDVLVCKGCTVAVVSSEHCGISNNQLLVRLNTREFESSLKIIEPDPFKIGVESDSSCFKKLKLSEKLAFDYKSDCASRLSEMYIDNRSEWIASADDKCESIETGRRLVPRQVCEGWGMANSGLDFKRDNDKYVA